MTQKQGSAQRYRRTPNRQRY